MKSNDKKALRLMEKGQLEKALAVIQKADETSLSFVLAKAFWEKGDMQSAAWALNLHHGEYLNDNLSSVRNYLRFHDDDNKVYWGLMLSFPKYFSDVTGAREASPWNEDLY